MYNSVISWVVQPNFRTLSSLQKESVCIYLLSIPNSSPRQLLIYLLSLIDLPFLDILSKCSHPMCSLLCLNSFPYNVFEVHPCCSMCPFLSMVAWIFHILSIYSSIDGHVDYFHFLVIINNAFINIHYKFLCSHSFSFLLGITGSYGKFMFNLLRNWNPHSIYLPSKGWWWKGI